MPPYQGIFNTRIYPRILFDDCYTGIFHHGFTLIEVGEVPLHGHVIVIFGSAAVR